MSRTVLLTILKQYFCCSFVSFVLSILHLCAVFRPCYMSFNTCLVPSTGYCPRLSITKTCLYNFDPRKPHFYIVELGFTGVYIIFLISAQKHRLWILVRTASRDCGYSLEPLLEAVLTSTHNLCFEQKFEKYQNFCI